MGGPMRCGSGSAPVGSIENGRILDAEGVAGALRQVIAKTEIQDGRVLVAISDALATFRVLKFASSTPEQGIDSAVAREFPLDPERMATRWIEVHTNGQHRVVYAAAWDRAQVRKVAETAKLAGLEPVVIDLKSACIARVVTEPSCVVLDLSSDPAELFLIDAHLPQLWHSFKIAVASGEDLSPALGPPLRSALRYYLRKKDSGFGSLSPVLITAEEEISTDTLTGLSKMLEHPVETLVVPARVPDEVRHASYLTCLGLIMRRSD